MQLPSPSVCSGRRRGAVAIVLAVVLAVAAIAILRTDVAASLELEAAPVGDGRLNPYLFVVGLGASRRGRILATAVGHQ